MEYFAGEELGGWTVFWLRLGLGLTVGVGVGALFIEDYAWYEVAVTESVVSEGGAGFEWIVLTGSVTTGAFYAT